VSGGREAIRALEEKTYDVVLCDLMMPGCTGAEVWKKAKEIGSEDRFVLMTGGATTEALRAFVERSRVRCVTKPAMLVEIEAAIDACLARADSSRPATPTSPRD